MLTWLWRRKSAVDVERLLQSAAEHHHAGRVAQAAAAYRMVLEADPSSFRAHYDLGLARLALGERAAAAASLLEAIRLQPQSAEAHYVLGHLYCDDDRAAEGLAHLRRALELRPDSAETRWSLALGGIPQVYASGEEPSRVRRELAAGLEGLEHWVDSIGTAARAAAAEGAVGLMQQIGRASCRER